VIRFVPTGEPPHSRAGAQARHDWLATNASGRLPPYWREATTTSRWRSETCAPIRPCTCIGSVDHFVSRDEDRSRAYDWANYRFASE